MQSRFIPIFAVLSIAFLDSPNGAAGATLLLAASALVWTLAPIVRALRRLALRDL